MHEKLLKSFYIVIGITLFWFHTASAADKTLSLVDSDLSSTIKVDEGEPVAVNILVDDASGIAAASFTVLYDTKNLSLRAEDPITSTFFQTFVQQDLLPPTEESAFITVADENYYSPILSAPLYPLYGPTPIGTRLAAARSDNDYGTNVTLFTLHFEHTGPPGEYPITITQTTLRNMRAGYRRSGERIPFLMGYAEGSDYQTHSVSTIVPGTIVVKPPFVDFDKDLIDDNWERAHVPPGTTGEPLDVFSYNGDYDHDGYTDYQEYINDLNGERDPLGNSYIPTEKNAAGGPGYVPRGFNALPAINLLLLGN